MASKSTASEEGGVAAVDRALSILEALTDDRVSLAELARRTGLYKSTVLRLLRSLERFGYVLRTADGSYRLGSKVLWLGTLYQRHYQSAAIVPPVLERLVAELHEGASFYIQEDDQRVCLHRAEASRAVRDSIHVGDRLPLSVGAAGHVLRAFGGAGGARFETIRRQMYAASFGERDTETAAMSSPVFGPGNVLVGALSVSGPRYRIEAVGEARIVPLLFKYAKELTRTLGGQVDDPTFFGWQTPPPGRRAAKRPVPGAAVRSRRPAAPGNPD